MRLAAAAVLAALALAGCGAPDELSRTDADRLDIAREDISDALETTEAIRTDAAERRRILKEVARVVSSGTFEAKQLDEFGLASLGELQLVLPSVVITDADGVPKDLDRAALRDFRRYAESRPRSALKRAARGQVAVIEKVIDESGADDDTAVGRETAGEYLQSVEDDLQPVWPDLAKRVADLP